MLDFVAPISIYDLRKKTFIDLLLDESRNLRSLIYSDRSDTHSLTTPQAQCAMAIYGLQ